VIFGIHCLAPALDVSSWPLSVEYFRRLFWQTCAEKVFKPAASPSELIRNCICLKEAAMEGMKLLLRGNRF
jgi:hypothetical protein